MNARWPTEIDDLGPGKVVHIHDAATGLRAIVVVDNVASGPAIGGLRMAPDVDVDTVFRLARTMTFKSAAVGLPHGGGKAGIISSPRLEPRQKERLVRAFARAIRDLTDYIPGPDMGTDETAMAFVHDEIGRAVGLPRVLGGIPLDEIGATGFGLAVSASVAQQYAGIKLKGARVAIQGFGNVGRHAARRLAERGAVVVAVSDSQGAVVNPDGLAVPALIDHKLSGRSVADFAGGEVIGGDELVGVACEIWLPAAQPNVLTADNVGRLKAKLVLCGANIPVTAPAEAALHDAGVVVVPDFIANAGGLIAAAVEYRGGGEEQAFAAIEELIARNTGAVLAKARDSKRSPRWAATRLAEVRVRQAMGYRRGLDGASPQANLLDM